MQPELAKDIEMIAAFPAMPAARIAENIMRCMVGYFADFEIAVVLRRQKEMPDPEYKRIE